MPNKSSNLGLNTWLENEVVNFEEINQNFNIIDGLTSCIETGTKTASYSGGVSGVATWYYRKYSDKSIDMWAKLEFDNLKCNGGTSSPYYSGDSKIMFPFTMSRVSNVQMHLASNTFGWVSNITGRSVLDSVSFRVIGLEYESTTEYKQIFIEVKGAIA